MSRQQPPQERVWFSLDMGNGKGFRVLLTGTPDADIIESLEYMVAMNKKIWLPNNKDEK